jgi:D-psicose/D-tagatose/L-ribulose 3-epimerase
MLVLGSEFLVLGSAYIGEVPVRFGCCVSPENIGVVAEAGFDFCELPTSSLMPLEDDTAALPALRAIAAAPLRPESFNVLVPGSIPLCGPNFEPATVRSYLRRAFGRMASLGGAIAVLGSGAARRIPDDWPREKALDQLADAFAIGGEESSRAGIALAIEHLNQKECNIFNTVGECHAFLVERGLGDVRLLADLYHIEVEQEPMANVVAAGSLIVHAHTAGGGRGSPDTPGYDYAGFVTALKAAGYDARISAENSWRDLAAQAPAALAFMKAGWEG